MADDGMVLNFAISDSGPSVLRKTKFEGGSWKDRRRLKRRSQKSLQNQKASDGSGQSFQMVSANHATVRKIPQEEFADSRPTKRRRENDNNVGTGPGPDGSTKTRAQEKHQSTSQRDVVSSLFTSNPTPSTQATEANHEEEEPSKPSNAPLIDGLDTFTSLGLLTTIAAHLLTKMNLKSPTAIQKAAISQMLREEGDAFIQSETGSGKTLAYLLPLVQRIIQISEKQQTSANESTVNALHRDSGLFAIILAPTRELCKQISVVLERLLGCAHYIVAGTVIGGEKKKSEKARLRKGINILVATPGRLVDHIDNTSALDVSRVRWLVLDEGDRLMDLGFEEDITKIITKLDQKQQNAVKLGLPERRTTILCSATLKMNVQKLGEISLKDAALIKGDGEDVQQNSNGDTNKDSAFLAPAQLKQSYIVVPAKLRLVTLTALLRRTFARKGSVNKAIVFLSCADSVDFHFIAFTRSAASANVTEQPSDESSSPELSATALSPTDSQNECIASAPLLCPSITLKLHKLHGSLPQHLRTSIINSFRSTTQPSLLLATDVASRGLDLPNLDLVIEYDPAFSSDDHLHRIGRTARVGRDGRAVIFLLPGKEEGYVDVLQKSYKSSTDGVAGNVSQTDATDILRKGFTPNPNSGIVPKTIPKAWEAHATTFQLDVERWVLEDREVGEAAKRAFQSHIRAYATHVAAERGWFDIAELHLGHLAKAFGLRERPGGMNVVGMRGMGARGRSGVSGGGGGRGRDRGDHGDGEAAKAKGKGNDDAAMKMREMVRKQRLMKGGGADEFNIA